MRWTPGHRSENVEDRRGQSSGLGGGGGGGLSVLVWLFSRFGLPGLLVGGAVLYFAGNLDLSGGGGGGDDTPEHSMSGATQGPEEEAVQFVSFVLDDVQQMWTEQFARSGQKYQLAKLVLFTGQTRSACGLGQSAMGPFYCPSDRNVYIDLSFYKELKDRFKASGDFAQAYVIAHEVGHHVQHLLGTDREVQSARSAQGAGGASVRLELQADCYAGVWGHSTERRSLLDPDDLEEALRAASAIGDDKLQEQGTGSVRPDSFTHGTSAERVRWFKRGFEQGDMDACDTFGAKQL